MNDAGILAVRTEHLNAWGGRDIETAGGIDRQAVAGSTRFELAEVAPVRVRAIRLDVEREDHGAVRHVQNPLIGTEHDPVRSDVLAKTRHSPGRIHVEGTARREIRTALPIHHEIVDAPERLAVDVVRQDLSCRSEHAHRRRLGTRRSSRRSPWIGTSSLHRENPSLGVDRHRTRAMSAGEGHGHAVVPIELADAIGLFLREQQSAVSRADETVRVISALPGKRPLRAGRDNAGISVTVASLALCGCPPSAGRRRASLEAMADASRHETIANTVCDFIEDPFP